jgi:hypothetical protein
MSTTSAQFQATVDAYRSTMRELRGVLERDGRIHAVSQRDSSYSILLTPNGSSAGPWRVTSFRGKDPIGHREYDRPDGGVPTQNALQEFAGVGWRLVPLPRDRREYSSTCAWTRWRCRPARIIFPSAIVKPRVSAEHSAVADPPALTSCSGTGLRAGLPLLTRIAMHPPRFRRDHHLSDWAGLQPGTALLQTHIHLFHQTADPPLWRPDLC